MEQEREINELAKRIAPIIAGHRLGAILKAFRRLEHMLIEKAVLGEKEK